MASFIQNAQTRSQETTPKQGTNPLDADVKNTADMLGPDSGNISVIQCNNKTIISNKTFSNEKLLRCHARTCDSTDLLLTSNQNNFEIKLEPDIVILESQFMSEVLIVSNTDNFDSTKGNIEIKTGEEMDSDDVRLRAVKDEFNGIAKCENLNTISLTDSLSFDIKVEEVECTEATISDSTCTISGQSIDPLKIELPEEVLSSSMYDYAAAQSMQITEHVEVCMPEKPEKKYKCNTCYFTTTQHRFLKTHQQRHVREQSVNVDMRRQTAENAEHVEQHASRKRRVKLRTGEKPFKCTLCDYASTRNTNLKQHMKMHTGEKPFKCNVCDYASAHNAHVIQHIRTHTGVKPFQCTICDYASVRSTNLVQHMRMHTGEKPFKCMLCDYAGANRSRLTQHMRRHTGEKPFKCTLCDYSSAQSSVLKWHMKKHHHPAL